MNKHKDIHGVSYLSAEDIAAMENAAYTTQHLLDEDLAKQAENARGLTTILWVRPFLKKPMRVTLPRHTRLGEKPIA